EAAAQRHPKQRAAAKKRETLAPCQGDVVIRDIDRPGSGDGRWTDAAPRGRWAARTTRRAATTRRSLLPRKEVIQPHLPVRLPCYDFTPVTPPTLDSCPPAHEARGLAHRLQVLAAPMV